MEILQSLLMGKFIGLLKSNWDRNSRVSQRRRRLRQLVDMVQGVAGAAEGRPAVRRSSFNRWLQQLRKEALQGQAVLDATTTDPFAVVGAAKMFLAGLKALFVCSAEVDRLTDAVDALDRLTDAVDALDRLTDALDALEPLAGADLHNFLKVLQLDVVHAMDVDGDAAPAPAWAAHYVDQGSYSVATAPGAKRKRAVSSGVDQAEDGDGDGDAASHSHARAVVDRAYRQKRRALACKRHTSSGPPTAGPHRSVPVAMGMARVHRRIGTPSLGQPFSRISLYNGEVKIERAKYNAYPAPTPFC